MRPSALSHKGALFIAGFEGFVSHPYNDAANNATIGYGHLLHHGPFTNEDLREWGHITHERGIQLLQNDARRAAHCVLENVEPSFQFQWRFDAITSFVFNLGCGYLGPKSTIGLLLQHHGLRREAADALLLYNHAGGQRLPGLTRRRHAERSLFLYGRYRNRYTR